MYFCGSMKKYVIHIVILIFFVGIAKKSLAFFYHDSERKEFHEEKGCARIDSIIAFSMTKLGCAYHSGGTGPRSFDCSGFMYYVFKQFGVQLGRSSRDQFRMGEKVNRQDIQPGDLVFWYRGKGYIGHVGMVISVDSAHNFRFIHAATHGKGVRIDHSTGRWYSSTYAGARRILHCGEMFQNTENVMDKSDLKANNRVGEQGKDTLQNSEISHVQKAESPTSLPAPKLVYHKIRQGETLSSIARKYHVSVEKLKTWNHLKSDFIRADSKLKIYK